MVIDISSPGLATSASIAVATTAALVLAVVEAVVGLRDWRDGGAARNRQEHWRGDDSTERTREKSTPIRKVAERRQS